MSCWYWIEVSAQIFKSFLIYSIIKIIRHHKTHVVGGPGLCGSCSCLSFSFFYSPDLFPTSMVRVMVIFIETDPYRCLHRHWYWYWFPVKSLVMASTRVVVVVVFYTPWLYRPPGGRWPITYISMFTKMAITRRILVVSGRACMSSELLCYEETF